MDNANETECPNGCVNGWVECSWDDCEAMMDKYNGRRNVPVMFCPHCSNKKPARGGCRGEDFHADI